MTRRALEVGIFDGAQSSVYTCLWRRIRVLARQPATRETCRGAVSANEHRRAFKLLDLLRLLNRDILQVLEIK